jgi:hypothetical protein
MNRSPQRTTNNGESTHNTSTTTGDNDIRHLNTSNDNDTPNDDNNNNNNNNNNDEWSEAGVGEAVRDRDQTLATWLAGLQFEQRLAPGEEPPVRLDAKRNPADVDVKQVIAAVTSLFACFCWLLTTACLIQLHNSKAATAVRPEVK